MHIKIEDIQIAEFEPVIGHPDPAGEPGEEGVNRAQLVKRLREVAELTPPVCHYYEPEEITVFGKKITVYCKPFEQFQFLLKMAADTIEAEMYVPESNDANVEAAETAYKKAVSGHEPR